jgi:outer membrane receptor protein involved in Fe transport
MAFRSHLAAVLLSLAAAFVLPGQNPTATLVGAVTDSSGAAVAAARLEVRHIETNELRHSASDVKGEFTVPDLAPGPYEITVSREGFRTIHETGLVLQMEQTARMEFHLEVGAMSQAIEVTASIPLINTENAVKGEVLVTQEIVEMPLNGHDFSDLAFLTPGVVPRASGGQGSNFNINGARADNTNFIIDGFNDQNPRASAIQVQPNLDALAEFKMQTTGYSAEYGRLAGGVMNMVLKAGTNQFHGAAFEFLRHDVFDARNFFDTSKSALERNQFGGTLSGPVVIPKLYNGHDRTFFLFSWESYRQTMGSNRLGIVPTAAQRQGDFSGFAPLKDPFASGKILPNNQIPPSRFNAVSLQAQDFYPPPNRPGQVNNYLGHVDDSDGWDSDVIKIDHRFSTNDTVSFRWMKRYNRTSNPFNGSDLGTFGDHVYQHQTLTGLTYTRMFSPAVIGEARIGFSRTTDHEIDNLAGTDYNLQLGLPSPRDPKLIGFPRFVITGYEALGAGNQLPVDFTVNNIEWTGMVTWVKGAHLVKFGVDILRTQFFQPYYNNNRGTFNFLGKWTGEPYADFALGILDSSSHQIGTTPNYLFSTNYSGFAQDDWKLAGRITLSLGLRYELPTPPAEKYGRWTNFIPEFGKLVLASDATLAGTGIAFSDPTKVATAAQLGLPPALVYTRYSDLAPRIGLAWRPFGGNRAVVRAGYGIFYGTAQQNPVRNSLANVFPFAISQTFNKKLAQPTYLTLDNPFPGPPNLSGNVTNANGFELNARTPGLQSWNLTVEREIGLQSAVEVSYVGSKGSHLGRQYNINQPYRSAALAPNFPNPYPGFNTINYYGFNSNSTYNAATVTFRRRFVRNFFYRASYSYGKSIDDASQLQGSSSGGIGGAQNVRNLHGDRGRSDWDVGHSLNMAFSWTAPWRGNVLVRGWQLAGSGRAYTGQPFTPQVSNVNLDQGEANRPDRIAKGTPPDPGPEMWFNLAAFPVVPAGSYRFGNAGRNILDAPGFAQINLSLYKNFSIRERHRVQFRWEVFNTLNHANFDVPSNNVNQPNAGTITQAKDPRLMQFGLRYLF